MTQAVAAEPLHLHRLTIENFMRIDALTVDAQGHHVVIAGKNCSGKTSTVDALWSALGGKPSTAMPEPIRKGSERAKVTLDLGEYVVEKTWTEKGSRLVITAEDGSKINKPQALLDGFLGRFSLDPIAFLSRRDQDQMEDVLAIAGKAPPVSDVEALLGEPFPARDGESAYGYLTRLAGDDVGYLYDRRRDAHRQATQKGAAVAEQRSRLAELGGPLKPEDKEETATEILKVIEGLQNEQERRRDRVAEAAALRLQHREATARLDTLKVQRGREVAERDELARQIEALLRRKASHEQVIADLDSRLGKGTLIVREADAEASTAEREAQAIPDRAGAIERCRLELVGLENKNKALVRRRNAAEDLRRLLAEHEAAETDHKTLDGALESIRGMRGHLLDGVDLGVPGLAVGNGELRLNGVSFKQASQSERLRTAAAIAFAQNPRLKLLRVDEAEALDRESMAALLAVASERQWQVIATRVADVDGLKVEVIDAD